MKKDGKKTEILYVNKEKSKAIVSRGNTEKGYSFFESKLKEGSDNRIDLSSIKVIDNIFDYIEDNNIDISNLQKINIAESVDNNEKTK